MKGFMARRKAKEQAQTDLRGTPGPELSHSLTKSSKKSKKQDAEPVFEFDLASALPDTDSFRTSLMMNNFSARFSMLREQDDPNTKIGKASDDSVLFPKRASRLNVFNHNPLNDIAEVESLRGSTFRPPFAQQDRAMSYGSDGYASDEGGSMMSRAKPGEGNNLFGGRQKLYKIPVGSSSAKNLGDPDATERDAAGMRGRHMYENDVSMSMFQQIREKEREERRQREQQHRSESSNNTEPEEIEATTSPSTGFSKDRGTNSSTTSGPLGRRTSTAATSVASETPPSIAGNGSASSLVTTKPIVEDVASSDYTSIPPRRLYGQTTDPTSPTHRAVRNVMESSNRPRAPTYERKPQKLSPSKSASNLNGTQPPPGPVYASAAFRTASPPPSATPAGVVPMDLGTRDRKNSASPANQSYGVMPPLSPPASDGEDSLAYANSIQPEDRGKATAMGLFNRPQNQFDEQQFSQRQVQMHNGRISPVPPSDYPLRRENNESPMPRLDSPAKGRDSPSVSEDQQFNGRLTSASGKASQQTQRSSPRPWNEISSSPDPAQPPIPRMLPKQPTLSHETISRARARAESLMRHQNDELAAKETERKATKLTESLPRQNMVPNPKPAETGTFLANFSPSDDEPESAWDLGHPQESRRPPSGVHPALRDGTIDFKFDTSVRPKPKPVTLNLYDEEEERRTEMPIQEEDIPGESPWLTDRPESSTITLTPGGGLGLSGMIRAHLRHDSDRSSIYPPSIAPGPPSPRETLRGGSSARSENPPESVHSNPWEFDDMHSKPQKAEASEDVRDPTLIMSQKAKQILGQAAAFQNLAKNKAQQVLGDEAPRSADEAPAGRSWQEEMRMRHQRDGSTETQHERENYKNELAERRKKVQETLKNVVETDSRSTSPARERERQGSAPLKPLAALRHKTSKNSIRHQQPEPQNKAMRMLGITNTNMSSDVLSDTPQEDMWKEEEERMLRDHARRKPNSSNSATQKQRSPHAGRPRPSPPRTSPYEDSQRSGQRSITPTSARNPRRDRADSNMSSRPMTHGGRYQGEVERPMVAGTGNHGRLYESSNKAPSVIEFPRLNDTADEPSYERSSSAMSGRQRQRSNSRHTAPSSGYFDSKAVGPNHSDPALDSELPPPLPVNQAYSANSTPPLSSPAYSNLSTPTLPSHSTSYEGSYAPSFSNRSTSSLAGRKKSVSKAMISEPTLLSSTSNIPTVGLPAPPNFRPHELATPPVPAMNPKRRRQTTTQSLFTSMTGNDKEAPMGKLPTIPHSPNLVHLQSEERSTFSDEGEQRQHKPRARLRKISSEGGNMNSRVRQQALMVESPAVPTFPPGVSARPPRYALNGGMF